MSDKLAGTTVLVTGAAGGLGKEIAQAYLDAGANVAICDVNKERLAGAQEAFTKSHGDRFFAQEADVTSEQSLTALVEAVVAKFSTLDILVNNAGITDVMDPAGTCSLDMWTRVMSINLTGPFLATKAAVSVMEKQERGVIINIGSNASTTGASAGVAYTVSKHGVLGLTRNTAAFYQSKGVYCLALLLGGMPYTNISEAFAKGYSAEGMQLMQSAVPGFKPGFNDTIPADVAKFCVTLADRSIAASMTGSCVPFNKNWPVA